MAEPIVPKDSMEQGKRLPCVLYQATASFEVTEVSDSVQELLGLDSAAILKSRSFWQGCLFECDTAVLEEKLVALKTAESVSFVHRMLNAARLPVWVSHSIKKDRGSAESVFRGCLVPILDDRRIFAMDQTLVERFVHKLGNHFQLLNLVAGSLKKALPPSRDSEILLETLDKAAELTRTFAESNQVASWLPEVQIAGVLRGVLESHRPVFSDRGVRLIERIDESLDHAKLAGDPFVLESAFNYIMTEVLAAAHDGEVALVTCCVAQTSPSAGVAKLRFANDRMPVFPLAYEDVHRHQQTTQKSHDELGVPLATRFIELHGGLLTIERVPAGVKIFDVWLPVSLLDGGCWA